MTHLSVLEPSGSGQTTVDALCADSGHARSLTISPVVTSPQESLSPDTRLAQAVQKLAAAIDAVRADPQLSLVLREQRQQLLVVWASIDNVRRAAGVREKVLKPEAA